MERAHALNLQASASLPFWLYTVNSTNPGQLLDDWMFQQLDSATIMSYRNNADGIFGVGEAALIVGQKYSKSVSLAVETRQSEEGDNVSFYGMSDDNLNTQIAAARSEASKYSSFNGITVHDYVGWQAIVNA